MSKSAWTRTPVSRPSASAPNVAVIRAGWRFVVAAIDSGREYTPGPGGRGARAAIAISGWIDRSSLPPKPPPQALGMTRTRSCGRPRIRASSSRSMYGVWVVDADLDAAVDDARRPGLGLDVRVLDERRLEASRSRSTAAPASAASTSPAATRPRRARCPGDVVVEPRRRRVERRRRCRAAAAAAPTSIGSSSSSIEATVAGVADEREHGLADGSGRSPRRAPAGPCRSRRCRTG